MIQLRLLGEIVIDKAQYVRLLRLDEGLQAFPWPTSLLLILSSLFSSSASGPSSDHDDDSRHFASASSMIPDRKVTTSKMTS